MTCRETGKTTSTECAKGSVKEAIGKLTGDTRVEAEGRAQKGPRETDPTSGERSRTGPRS